MGSARIGKAPALGAVALAGIVLGASACTQRAAPPELVDVGLRDASVEGGAQGCHLDVECADRFACTVDHCTAGVCEHVPCVDCCGEGRACNPFGGCGPIPETCETDADCTDAQPCTLDACRARVCQHQPMDALCPASHICLAAIGCTPRPPDHCTTDADCAVIGFCYGAWTCSGEVGCTFVAPTDCDDGDVCTADRCDAASSACVHEGTDADGDAHDAVGCAGGDDCDDAVATTHPGATEACNGRDDDCDTTVDEGCCAAGPCETACHTTGMTGCNPDGTVGPCMPPAEVCNGTDDDCDGAADEDFDCVRGASSPCGTSCSTMGTSVCDASCHAGACAPPLEVCNGIDDDCASGPDDTFGCVLGSTSGCDTACASRGVQTCVAGCVLGTCVPPAETCNGLDDNCNGARDEGVGACIAGEMRACSALGMGFTTGNAVCRADCSGFDVAGCTRCGNNAIDAPEPCDGVALGGATCASRGYVGGTLRCAPGCVFDESSCTRCGNGAIDAGEQCDLTALGGASCTSLGTGFTGGTLRCGGSCTYDTTQCARCGNGLVESGEQCDGSVGAATCASVRPGYVGTLTCGSCHYDTSMCTWSDSGTWSVAPGVNYYCAFGEVSISFGNLSFNDTGASLTVSGGGLNCMMTGASARVSRTFDVSCTLPGACTETYRLTGTFDTDNSWRGTFRAGLTGSGCFDCSTQMYTGLTGSR